MFAFLTAQGAPRQGQRRSAQGSHDADSGLDCFSLTLDPLRYALRSAARERGPRCSAGQASNEDHDWPVDLLLAFSQGFGPTVTAACRGEDSSST